MTTSRSVGGDHYRDRLGVFVHRDFSRRFDDAAIVATLAHIAFSEDSLTGRDLTVLEAFRRSSPEFARAGVEQIGAYLADLDETQIQGVASNIKGIAHEIRFVELENADGDKIHASLFPETNHPGTDVVLEDLQSGEAWEVQLKATDDTSLVTNWLESHADGEILVTSELAAKLGVKDSGQSNEELTADVETFIDRAVEDDSIWDYVPSLAVASVAVIVSALFVRYCRGEITRSKFVEMAVRATGWKAGRILLLAGLLSIPGLNVATGAFLVARLLVSVRAATRRSRLA